MNNNYNSDFFSYYGKINRKNYIINLLILSALFLLLSITDFTIFTKFSSEILTTTVFSILDFLRFVIIAAILSVIYRRIADFSNHNKKLKTFFVIFYLTPFIFYYLGNFLFDFSSSLLVILNTIILNIIFPISIIAAIVFAFLKSKK